MKLYIYLYDSFLCKKKVDGGGIWLCIEIYLLYCSVVMTSTFVST